LAGAAWLLVLAYNMARVAAGHPSGCGVALAARVVVACMVVCAAGLLLLHSTPA
jgi:hypothetical protein